MSPDGSGQTRLTENDFNDSGAAWSHEAKRIAFQTNRNGYTQIFLMRVDGTEQHLLADTGVNEWGVQLGTQFPSWSPNGEQLCFSSQLRPREIFVLNADGSGLTNLTNNPADDLRCDWSPLGDKIAFGSTRDDGEEIYVMNSDGSNPVRLTFAFGPDANPDWSPNGARIAFESNRDGNAEIYVMNSDGTQQTRLTEFAGQDTKPSWSPKGDKIVFHRRFAGHLEVFTMNPDGTDVTQITFTASPGFSGFPNWAKGKLDH
jgi:Tol biopolymer transport system component